MRHRSREPVQFPNDHGIEMMSMSVGKKFVKFGTLLLRAGNPEVYVFCRYFPTSTLAIFAHFVYLHRRILLPITCAYSSVYSYFHRFFYPNAINANYISILRGLRASISKDSLIGVYEVASKILL